MAGRTIPQRTRELAYRVWRECGQNIEQTLKVLNDVHGFVLSKPTLYDWKDKYQWEERAARAEAEEKKAEGVSEEGKLILSLDAQRQKYERYFQSLPENTVDNQAVYAYTGLVKTIAEIKAKHAQYRAELFTEFMKELIRWAGAHNREALAALEAIFDDFTLAMRERFAA